MKKSILVVLTLTLMLSVFAQPKHFDPEFYMNASKSMKSDERKHLEEYRKKFVDLKLNVSQRKGYKHRYKYFEADEFYHYRINLDNYDKFLENGIDLKEEIETKNVIPLAPYLIESQVIIIGTLTEINDKRTGIFSFDVKFRVDSVLKGKYYYKDFPKEIKCYVKSYLSMRGERIFNYFFELRPKLGDKCYVYLVKEDINTYFFDSPAEDIPFDYYEANVFSRFRVQNRDWKQSDKSRKKIENKIRIFEELNKGEIFNKSRGEY